MAAEADEHNTRPLDWNHKTCWTQIGLLTDGLGRTAMPRVGPKIDSEWLTAIQPTTTFRKGPVVRNRVVPFKSH